MARHLLRHRIFRTFKVLVVLCLFFHGLTLAVQAIEPHQLDAAISKAVAYLAVDVPKWQADHSCASCHNQGDAARALVEAHRQGLIDSARPLESTLAWLSAPNDWKNNHGAPEFNDPNLATLQFAGTLLAAKRQWGARFETPLAEAAKFVVNLQRTDGSWRIDGEESFASPITHGPILLTGTGMQILNATNRERYKQRIEDANQWLLRQQPRNLIEASSLLIAVGKTPSAEPVRTKCLTMLLKAQGRDGGFGPYANAQSEVFDTALSVLALASIERPEEANLAIQRGVEYLLNMQEEGGHWNGTTRPSGTESYAHRISTTGWATQALLAARSR